MQQMHRPVALLRTLFLWAFGQNGNITINPQCYRNFPDSPLGRWMDGKKDYRVAFCLHTKHDKESLAFLGHGGQIFR